MIYGFEPFIKRDRLFFTTEIAVRVTFFTVQDTIFEMCFVRCKCPLLLVNTDGLDSNQ